MKNTILNRRYEKMYGFQNLTSKSKYEARRIKRRKAKRTGLSILGWTLATLLTAGPAFSIYLGYNNSRCPTTAAETVPMSSLSHDSLEGRTGSESVESRDDGNDIQNKVQTEVIIPKDAPKTQYPIKPVAEKQNTSHKEDKRRDYQFDDIINKYCQKTGLDFYIVKGMIYSESSFRPTVRGKDGEIGLMQLKIATAKMIDPKVTESDLENPEVNIRLGTAYLAQHFSKYDDTKIALMAYNCGPGVTRNIKKAFSNPIIMRYPNRICKAAQVYRSGKSFFVKSAA